MHLNEQSVGITEWFRLEGTLKLQPPWSGSNAKGCSSKGKIWEHQEELRRLQSKKTVTV